MVLKKSSIIYIVMNLNIFKKGKISYLPTRIRKKKHCLFRYTWIGHTDPQNNQSKIQYSEAIPTNPQSKIMNKSAKNRPENNS
jgi:hypothetical protein